MKMSKYYICCADCFDTIGRKSAAAAKLWMDLCAMRLSQGEIITLKTSDFPELRTLELMGFVVTSDTDLKLSVRVKGHCISEDGQDFFCAKEGRHE